MALQNWPMDKKAPSFKKKKELIQCMLIVSIFQFLNSYGDYADLMMTMTTWTRPWCRMFWRLTLWSDLQGREEDFRNYPLASCSRSEKMGKIQNLRKTIYLIHGHCPWICHSKVRLPEKGFSINSALTLWDPVSLWLEFWKAGKLHLCKSQYGWQKKHSQHVWADRLIYTYPSVGQPYLPAVRPKVGRSSHQGSTK